MGKKWIGILVTDIILVIGPFILYVFDVWNEMEKTGYLIIWPLYFLAAACAVVLVFVSNYYADFLEKQLPKSMVRMIRWGSFVLAECVVIIFSATQYKGV